MENNRLLRFALCAAALSTACMGLAGPDKPCTVASQEKAKDMLRRALTNGDRIAMNAVVLQRVTSSSDAPCQFTMSQDANGRRKMVAVKPLVVQGMVSFDDGEQWVNFYPDENRMIVMPSPRGDREDIDSRLKLAFQNYRFAVEPRARIAGRSATVVVAVPKFSGMPVRKYAIDDASNVLLRVESFDSNGDREVFFDTKVIQFGASEKRVEFRIGTAQTARVYRPEPPVRLAKLADARQHAGFAPLPIRNLPNGFEAKETIVAGSGNAKYVAIRLTDGLVSATLYQYPSKTNPIGRSEDGLEFSHQGVTVRLVGELSSFAGERMIDGIARTFGRTLVRVREPAAPVQTFSPKRYPEPEMGESDFLEVLLRLVEELIQAATNEIDPVIDGISKAIPTK